MNSDKLAAAYEAMRLKLREEQARKDHRPVRPFSDFDNHIARALYSAATQAMDDLEQDRQGKRFRFMSAETGSGKTNSAVAFIAAGFLSDPEFSAAYIVPSIRLVEEVGQTLTTLIGEENVCVWSDLHSLERTTYRVTDDDYGAIKMRKRRKSDLHRSRVIVVTHQLWLNELRFEREQPEKAHGGVRHYYRDRRSVTFVDEHPENIASLFTVKPKDITSLRDSIASVQPDHAWIAHLNAIIGRVEEVYDHKGQTYISVEEIVTAEEADAFRDVYATGLTAFADNAQSPALKLEQANKLAETAGFLIAAGEGCSFFSRRDMSFFAYRMAWNPGPGHVLLDATADITGMVAVMKGNVGVEVPRVDYSNLTTKHIRLPREYRYTRDILRDRRLALPYAEWIKAQVMENTEAGDDVLLVVQRDLIKAHGFGTFDGGTPSNDPSRWLDWEGRRVNVIHWGTEVGMNAWRDKTKVFLFGQFIRPKAVTLATTYGWQQTKVNGADLRAASYGKLSGHQALIHEGHVLRWLKQLACRGSVRNVTEGRCGAMTLYAAMDLDVLLRNWERLFWKAPPPITLNPPRNGEREEAPVDDATERVTGVDRLVTLLADPDRITYESDEVGKLTRIGPRELKRYLAKPTAASAMKLYGWRFIPGRGRGNKARLTKDGD